jgi:hypothetical protein
MEPVSIFPSSQDPVVSHLTPISPLTPWFFKIRLNIIFPTTLFFHVLFHVIRLKLFYAFWYVLCVPRDSLIHSPDNLILNSRYFVNNLCVVVVATVQGEIRSGRDEINSHDDYMGILLKLTSICQGEIVWVALTKS